MNGDHEDRQKEEIQNIGLDIAANATFRVYQSFRRAGFEVDQAFALAKIQYAASLAAYVRKRDGG